jgi:predicted nuclease with RNAse H fold
MRNAAVVRVMGVDLAAKAETTGAVVLEAVDETHWRAVQLSARPTDEDLVSAAGQVEIIGVDSPLGWPKAFVKAVHAHHSHEPWPGGTDRSNLTHRDTDRAIRRLGIRAALSVSADKLGSVAMRCALLQQQWAGVWGRPAPRDGSGRLVETYPAAALTAWRLESTGYKDRRNPVAARTVREQIIQNIGAAVEGWLDVTLVSERCVESDHVLDALVSGLVAIAAAGGATHEPSEDERPTALVEGWIHVPSAPLSELRPPGSACS